MVPRAVSAQRCAMAERNEAACLIPEIASGFMLGEGNMAEHMQPIKLIERQVDDLAFLRKHTAAALWHEVGVGKTPPIIRRVFDLLEENPLGFVMVVCPRTLFDQWVEKIHRVALGADLEKYKDISVRCLTGGDEKPTGVPRERIVLVNYEFIPSIETWIEEMADKGHILCVVLDEAHRIKGFRGFRSKHGVRAKILNRIAPKIPFRYMMSGSPVLNPNSSDVWAMYHFLDPTIFGPTRWRFISEFFYNLAQGQPYERLVLKPGAQEEISRRMYGPARRILKKDCAAGEFPEARRIPYFVEMPPKVARVYKDMKQSAIAVVNGEQVTRLMILSRLMALQQIASGFINTETGVHEIDASHKLKALDEILDELGDKQVVIWGHFRHELELLDRHLRERGRSVSLVYGGIGKGELSDRVRAFQKGRTDTFVGHPAAAGAGLDLQCAQDAIRFSRSYILEHFEQSEGRTNRAYSEHDFTTHHEIVSEKTEDEKVYRALIDRKDLSSVITMDFLSKDMRNV